MRNSIIAVSCISLALAICPGCTGGDGETAGEGGTFTAAAGTWFGTGGTGQSECTLEIVSLADSKVSGRIRWGSDNRSFIGMLAGDSRTLTIWFEDGSEWHVTVVSGAMTGIGWKNTSNMFTVSLTKTADSVSSQAETAAESAAENESETEKKSSELIGYTSDGRTAYSGTLRGIPVLSGSFSIVAGGFVFHEGGKKTLTGNAGNYGTIDYEDGEWSITFGGQLPPIGTSISAAYLYGERDKDTGDNDTQDDTETETDDQPVENGPNTISGEKVGSGVAAWTAYSGSLSRSPIVSGSLTLITGGFVFIDNRNGTLSGTAGTSGTINYTTASWTIDLGANQLADGTDITASYNHL